MTTEAHGHLTPRQATRAWSIALYVALAAAVLIAAMRVPGLWPPRWTHDAPSGITPQ